MRAIWHRLLASITRFGRRQDAAAAVEFALILPIMLLVYVGSVEASALISMDRRVQSVSGAMGDLVARADKTITATTLTDYFTASAGIMTPYPSDDLQQIVTQVLVDNAGVAKVVWSKQYIASRYATGTKYLFNATYPLPAEMAAIAKGKYVIVAEASYNYLPLYGIVFEQAVPLRRDSFFMPRFGGSIAVN